MTKMLLQEGHELSEPINSSVTQSCFAPGRVALERLLSTLSRGDEDTEFILQSIRLFEDVEQILRNQGYLNVGSHCLRLAVTLFDCYNTTGEDSLLTEAVNLGREALTRHPSDHPNRAACCGNVAVLLKTSYKVTHIDAFLVEAVILEREVLSLHPVGPEHVKSCGNLANSLAIWYESTRDHSILMKAIDLQRHALSSSPSGHPDYERSCENLSLILQLHYETSGATHILLEVIDLQRETISLRPPGHPNCAQAYLNLAISLKTYYNSSGDHSLLREVIDLERQALSLYPPDQPTRSRPLTNLALSLTISYESSGDVSHLLEAIELQRVSLSLRNAGHPDKASDCGNLAKSLITHYTSTGDDKLLMEAISLQRESLSLCHVDHPDHGLHCINLAGSLRTRYYNTGDDNLLMEAIDLQRESLSIHSTGHPSRDITCQNLAASLLLLYDNINDDLLLVEATTLLRESLSLCPPGHLDRGKSCLNLALSLKARHEKTGEDDLVTEAIDLEREALALHPPGHPGHAISCWNLANSLRIHYIQSANEHLLDEIHQCCTEGLSMDYPSRKWRNATMLAWLHMQTGSTRFDVHAAIQYLDQSLVNHSDSIIEATSLVMFCLKHLWEDSGDILEREHHIALTPVYRQLIKLLPFLTYPVLETRIQLKALRMASQIGSDVFVNSVLAENWTMGLEDLELAQGLMWSQRLHYRDPQLEDVPALLSQQLKDLLKGLALSSARTGDDRSASTVLTSRDLHHDQAAQVYLLLREIRALPGLDRFMLAETYSTLASVASVHPVVVLVGAHGRFYAVLLTSDTQNHALLPLDWRSEDFDGALAIMNSARSHRGAHSPPGESEEPSGEDIKRAAKIRKITPVTSSSRWLRLLWFKLVRPVLDRLGIKVGTIYHSASIRISLPLCSQLQGVHAHGFTGALLENSVPFLYMQLVSMMDQQICKSAAQITLYLLILPL
jgi:hypothetical protein